MVTTGLNVSGVEAVYGVPKRGAPVEPVLRGVSLSVAPGEVVAILGPSGSGKSTLLRVIAGLEPATAGEVSWDGVNLNRVDPHERGFGMVFQDAQLFPHLNVARNIGYGLRGAAWPKAVRAARVSELLHLVGLPDAGDRPVTQLSGGERQRIALARSLAPKPRVLLLDEPLSALDRALRERLAAQLSEILRVTGTAAIFVTHDESEAETIADRTMRMSDGKLVPQ